MSLRWRYDSRGTIVSGAFALDFGSSVTRIASPSGEMLFEEPTLAVVELSSDRLLAFGTEAASFGAHSAGHVAMIRPVRAGKLVDVDVATAVVAEVFRRIGVGRLEHREVALCTHVDASAVQRRALERAIRQAGSRRIQSVEQPIAAAIGAGLPLSEAIGSMVVDIGGGTSNVGVMALGGLVARAAADIGGLDFDQAIRTYLTKEHGLALSQRRVEALRRRYGSLAPAEPRSLVVVEGRDAKSGRPSSAEVTVGELAAVLDRAVEPLMALAVRCITESPPDVANDLVGTGLTLVGGGSRLDGLDERLAFATGVPVHVPAEPDRLSVRGAARCLAEDYSSVKVVTELKFG
jgi:rod shape-determining protein MreB and related proteins